MRVQKSAWYYYDSRLIQTDYSKISDSAVDVLLKMKSGSPLRLYLFLIQRLNGMTYRKKPEGWRMGENYIMEHTGLSRASLYRSIKELESANLLHRTKTKAGQMVSLVSPAGETENRKSVQNRGNKKETPKKSHNGDTHNDSGQSQGSHEQDHVPIDPIITTSCIDTKKNLTSEKENNPELEIPFWLTSIDKRKYPEAKAWFEWRKPLKEKMGSQFNIWISPMKGLMHHRLDETLNNENHLHMVEQGWKSINHPMQHCKPGNFTMQVSQVAGTAGTPEVSLQRYSDFSTYEGCALVLYCESIHFLKHVKENYEASIKEAIPHGLTLIFTL